MSITAEEVRKLAALSRIQVSDAEVVSLQGDMASILGYIEQINKANLETVADILPERRNVFREDGDANEPGSYTEKLLTNAPGREDDYVKVKKIL